MEVAGGVQGQFADEFAGVALHDPDVEVVDEQGDRGSGQAAAQSEVVQVAVVAQRHGAALVNAVVADTAVWIDVGAGRGGLRAGGVGLPGRLASIGSMGSGFVVVGPEPGELAL